VKEYLVLSKDTVVASAKDNTITIINEKKCPLRFHRSRNFEEWLNTRYSEMSRSNSRIDKNLHFKSSNMKYDILFTNSTRITDNYCVK